jgi:histidinol dehydrogenase
MRGASGLEKVYPARAAGVGRVALVTPPRPSNPSDIS